MVWGFIAVEVVLTWLAGTGAIVGTWVAGYPLIGLLRRGGMGLSQHVLGVLTGICLLSLVGGASEISGFDPLYLQGLILILGIGVGLYLLIKEQMPLTSRSVRFIIPSGFFCLFLWTFFCLIGTWMGGDTVAHASIIRLLIDHHQIPLSIPPLGSYWEYYPKGFHLFAYVFAKGFGILPVIQTVPVFLTALLPLTVSAILLERDQEDAAWYALLFGLFCVPQISVALIWGGYPSITAGVLIAGTVLAYHVDKRLIPLFGAGILIIHSREFALFLAALAGICIVSWIIDRSTRLQMYMILVGAGITAVVLSFLSIPTLLNYLHPALADPTTIASQAIRWYWVFPAICGIGVAILSHGVKGRDLLGWLIGPFFFLLIVLATNQTDPFPPERILTDIAVPLVGMGGITLAAMARGAESPKFGGFLSVLLILMGLFILGSIFGTYMSIWALPKEDHNALSWLSDQNYANGILINLDETGSWAYPLTGIPVSHPRVIPSIEYGDRLVYAKPWTIVQISNISWIQGKTKGYDPVLVYKSSVSSTRPGFTPPFAEYPFVYPDGTINLSPGSYSLLYDKGTQIYELNQSLLRI
ncbi:MAG TPA: hypothetical protein VN372_00285 [Methanospirillum sp.]|nr:hypothetical protein [Methanospirillum sp.]